MEIEEIIDFIMNLSSFGKQFFAFFVASCFLWLVWFLFTPSTPNFKGNGFRAFGIAYCCVILCTLQAAIPCLVLGGLMYKPIKEYVKNHIKDSEEYNTGKNLIDARLKNQELVKRKIHLETQLEHLSENKERLEKEIAKLNDRLVFQRKLDESKIMNAIAEKEREQNLQAKHVIALMETAKSNLSALPYMARIIADFDTRNLEIFARQLDWGDNQERKRKVRSLRELRKETAEMVAHYKEAEYKLAYAMEMFPALEDFFDTDSQDVPELKLSDLEEEGNHDRVRDYLSADEYCQLSSAERSQLALDRYRTSYRKSKWQVGRDYETYVGYRYESKGYHVDYYGIRNGLEDLGRDLIVTGNGQTLIVQCKYWSAKKVIREKHIAQLFGTTACYCYENNLPKNQVVGVLVTNITVSDTAKKFADYLGIRIAEQFPLGDYPCIKCNINRSAEGGTTYIYHLPFDQQYDTCVISGPGEFMAMTAAEAEEAGFRRAYRWHNK